jgi:hypothetical protein
VLGFLKTDKTEEYITELRPCGLLRCTDCRLETRRKAPAGRSRPTSSASAFSARSGNSSSRISRGAVTVPFASRYGQRPRSLRRLIWAI